MKTMKAFCLFSMMLLSLAWNSNVSADQRRVGRRNLHTTVRVSNSNSSVSQFGGTYEIVNINSGKCLDIRGYDFNNHAPLIQYSCNGQANQTFTLTRASTGSYSIVANHSGKCLDVALGSTGDGTQIIQYDCHGGANQTFKVESLGDGNFRLVAEHSQKCVDVAGASTGDDIPVIQYSCHGGANQKFGLRKK